VTPQPGEYESTDTSSATVDGEPASAAGPFPADVAEVLAGNRSYDSLQSPAQAIVRAEWDRRIEERLASLDLAAEFEARGETYCTYVDGSIVIHNP
jgi:hypothetical protein